MSEDTNATPTAGKNPDCTGAASQSANICDRCGNEMPPDAKRCPICRHPRMKKACPECNGDCIMTWNVSEAVFECPCCSHTSEEGSL